MKERTERMSKREREHEERWKIKENDVQVRGDSTSSGPNVCRSPDFFRLPALGPQHLHDEILSLHLELDQLSQRNSALQADNASLLQRWLDKMNERVDKMNADFESESSKEPDKGATNGGTSTGA